MSCFTGVKEEHRISLTWDLDIDVNDTSTDITLPAETRFGGKWFLQAKVTAPLTLELLFKWEDVELGAIGGDFKPEGKRSGQEHAKLSWERYNAFPNKSSSCLSDILAPKYFSQPKHRRYRVELILPGVKPSVSTTSAIPRHELARYLAPVYASQHVNDVRITFPHAGAELWASSAVLCAASPYFATLLGSEDFMENIEKEREEEQEQIEAGELQVDKPTNEVVLVDRQRRSASSLGAVTDSLFQFEAGGPTIANSDDETDELTLSEEAASKIKKRPTYREIKITETAYSTYRAVLLYLHTSRIAFAPLTSSLLPDVDTAEESRTEYLTRRFSQDSALPLPVSPNSVYRLAHILELPQLMQLALANIKCQLTVQNAARELFSDTSALYDEVRTLVMDFVVANWAEVKASQAMKDVERMTKAGELPRAGAVLRELMARVSP